MRRPEIHVEGVPGYVPEELAEEFRNRLSEAVHDFLYRSGMRGIQFSAGTEPISAKAAGSLGDSAAPPVREPASRREEISVEERAQQYSSRRPFFDFDFLVVPDHVRESLLSAVDLISVEELVFDRWNLRSIEPFPRAALNLHGAPGTGKTLAAHALANYLNKPILLASYAQIESKYVGDGAKNVEAVFHAAERDGAVLFIDESDSLLSRRLTEVNQGAEQAINSMRSQLLISLEGFSGIVIFSTNLVENYDRAFDTRMRHVFFPMPGVQERREIWRRHLPAQLPLTEDVSIGRLAEIEDLCGRDIKNAVIDAALRAARGRREEIAHRDLEDAATRVKEGRIPAPRSAAP